MADPSPRAGPVPAAVGAWLAYLAVDFLLHAVALESWWRAYERHWLPPRELFARIPFGYASFAVYCAALVWLVQVTGRATAGPTAGARFGAVAGLVYGAAVALAVHSVFDSPPSLLPVWTASAALGSAAAGAAAAWIIGAARPWRRVGATFGLALAAVVVGVVIQNVLNALGG